MAAVAGPCWASSARPWAEALAVTRARQMSGIAATRTSELRKYLRLIRMKLCVYFRRYGNTWRNCIRQFRCNRVHIWPRYQFAKRLITCTSLRFLSSHRSGRTRTSTRWCSCRCYRCHRHLAASDYLYSVSAFSWSRWDRRTLYPGDTGCVAELHPDWDTSPSQGILHQFTFSPER